MADKELLAAIKAEFGAAAAPILERMDASEARAKKADEKIEQLMQSAAAAPAVNAHLGAIQRGAPLVISHDETPETYVERLLEQDSVRQIAEQVLGRRGGNRVRAHVRSHAGLDFVRILRAMGVAKIRDGINTSTSQPSPDSVLKVLSDWGDKRVAGLVEAARDHNKRGLEAAPKERERMQRAMNSSVVGAGAGFVSKQVFGGFIDFNWPATVARALGALSIPVTKNSIDLLYIDSAAGAARRGQLTAATQTSIAEKQLTMTLTLLSAFMAASNELLDEADLNLDVLYRSMLSKALARQENLDFLTGLGVSSDPRGFDWWCDDSKNTMVSSAHDFTRTLNGSSVPDFDTIRKDLFTAMQAVEEEDIAPTSPGWGFSVAVQYGLMRCINSNDMPAYADEMRGGTLLGAPFKASTQIVKNLAGDGSGSGTGNKGNIYYADWSTFAIAEDPSVDLKVVDGGTYKDVNGNTITGLTTNETVFVIHAKNTPGCLQRGKELCRINSVDWQNLTTW
jgi:HK97 family phage major capsid protein